MKYKKEILESIKLPDDLKKLTVPECRRLAVEIRKKLRNSDKIDKTRLFITHAGLPAKSIEAIKSEINKLCSFEEITVTKASATVSSNCGPGTVGVLFVKKQIEE